MCEMRRNACVMGGGILVKEEKEYLCDGMRNSCMRGGGIHV